MSKLKLEIVTPKSTLLEVNADWVTLPGEVGQLGIYPEHIPLVSTLTSGVLYYSENSHITAVAVHWGYAQVDQDNVTVLAEIAEQASEIDSARAEAAKNHAEGLLVEMSKLQNVDFKSLKMAEVKFKKAVTRMEASEE